MPVTAPYQQTVNVPVPAMATAASDENSFVARAPFNGTVDAVRFTADAAITGVNTNTRAFQLINKGQAGAGSTVIATLQMNAGVNAVAGDELTIPVTPANAAVVAGDILAWFSDAILTGIADPGGMVSIDFSRS